MQDAHGCLGAAGYRAGRGTFASLLSSSLKLLAFVVLLVGSQASHAGVSYAYDDLGRVTQATYTDGSIVQYQYDANGNIVAINRLQTSALSISSFTPAIGQANSIVTITGSGFSATPGDNAVTVGGAAAVVSSASATQLVITVPMAAQTGTIGVTVGANSTASAQQFVVRRPVITSFSPSVVNAGATITIVGSNLALAPPAATVTVGGISATVTSVTNTQVVFTAPANGSGTIQVTTSYGQTTSTAALTVMPSAFSAANVGAVTSATAGGAPVTVTNAQVGKLAVLAFDAVAGQLISVQASGFVSVPTNVTAGLYLYSPSGALVMSSSIPPSAPSVHLPVMPATGRYLMVISPGNVTYQFNAVVELNSVFANTSVSSASFATTANGQTKRIGITGGAGQHVSIGLTHLTMNGVGSITFAIYRPDGTLVFNRYCYTSDPLSSCGLSTGDLPVTGTYQLMATPNGSAIMSFDLTVSPPLTGTLDTGGASLTVNMAQPAQLAVYTFAVTQGQSMALSLDSIASTPANQSVYLSFRRPDGSEVTNRNTSTGLTLTYSNLAAGTYRIYTVPYFGTTVSVRLRLVVSTPPSLASNGTTSSTFTTPFAGQVAYFNVPGTAGQNIAIALRHLVMSPGGSVNLSLYQPNGTYMWGRSCFTSDPVSSCGIEFTNIPETGNYQLVATPDNAATMSFDLTVSQALEGTLTPGTPANLDLSVPGRFAYYSFTATAGQTYSLNVGSIVTVPAGLNMYLAIMRPDGSSYTTQSTTTGTTVLISNAVAGTWKVFLVPYFGGSGSAQLSLSTAVTGSLTMNATPVHFNLTVPGQAATITFQGTSGQSVELASTNVATNPTSASGVTFSVAAPNSQQVASFTGYRTSNPGDSSAFNLPQTGAYTITATPTGGATASFDLNVSTPFTGTVVKGSGPLFVNMAVPAQFGYLDFTATAGQSLTINFTSVTTVPAAVQLWIDVVNPGGSIIATAHGTATTRQVNLSGLAAGTYHIYLWPTQAVTTSMNIEIP